jgi:hypothetical protein
LRYMMIHYLDDSVLTYDGGDVEYTDPAEVKLREAWDEEMDERGILVGGGVLHPARKAKVGRVRGGEVLAVDGPFAETKEQIAGYSILECADLVEAIEVSSRHPTARLGSFELREYLAGGQEQ